MIRSSHNPADVVDCIASLPERFETLVAQQPQAPLLAYGEWRLNYGDVNRAANRLAHRLIGLGVAANVPVGLGLERGPDLLVAILAVLKAGGAYVPLDPHWPASRLRHMAEAARPAVFVTRTSFRSLLPATATAVLDLDRDQAAIAREPDSNPGIAIDGGQWCYVLFTSGSTGKPKGVPVTHGNLARLFPPLTAALDLGPQDVWTWFHSASFGFSVWEMCGALLHGAALVIVPEHIRQDPVALGELLADEQVTVFSQTPSAFRRVLHEPRFHASVAGSPLRYLALSGEAIRRDDISEWLGHGHQARLINSYAVTETAGQVALRIYGADDGTEAGARNLGQPLAGRHVLILDSSGQPLPAGTPGELWVGGDLVAPGYLCAPELATRFVDMAVPEHGTLHGYRTGDRMRQLVDGSLEYLGRIDAQLKFRGYRIEPGDIETALRDHPGVLDAAVGVRPDAAGNQRLTAWVVRDPESAVESPGARQAEFWPSLGAYGIYDAWLYGLMNTEPQRLAAYRAAFVDAVPGKIVLDIGTGQDAVLARLCVEAGATHVYAVEVLEEPARRAAQLVRELGLADRITVLQGDIAEIELPVEVDVCTQGIIGNIGSADGIAPVWNSARRHFSADCIPVPARCVTRIAALELPAGARDQPVFGPLATDYVQRLFNAMGQAFDLRLCLRNVAPSALLSTSADFEVLDFSGELAAGHTGSAELAFTRDGLFDGCLLWTVVDAGAGHAVDYLREQQAWLPVYMPLADEPVPVRRGETVHLDWQMFLESDSRFPDYRITARLHGVEFTHQSCHRGHAVGATRLHRQLLAPLSESIPDSPLVAGPANSQSLSVTGLRQWLQSRVPEHLVPQSWVFLPRLPLGPGDKLDRNALPAPDGQRPALADPAVAPRTAAEVAMAGLWTEILGLESLGVADDFFELGGDSIAAVQLVTRLQRWLDASLPLAALFEAPTIAGLTHYVEEKFAGPLAAALRRTAGTSPAPEVTADAEVDATHDARHLPLTFSQLSLWFLNTLYPGDTSANEQFVIRLRGPLDTAALARAWLALLQRHPVLLATFEESAEGGVCLEAGPEAAARSGLAHVALASADNLQELAEAALREHFDLGRGPLTRARLCVLQPDECLLVVTAHHIVADGMSVRILRDDLAQLYAMEVGAIEAESAETGARSTMSGNCQLPGARRYANLVSERRWLEGRVDSEALAWWAGQLQDPPSSPLRALVRPVVPPAAAPLARDRTSRRVPFALDAALANRVRRLAREAGATPYMVVLAAFRVLLVRLTGQADICIGTPMTLRDSPELKDIVGCLVNPVVLRNTVRTDQSFQEHLYTERRTALDAFRFRDVPFSRIVEAVAPLRQLGEHPLFQILFSWESATDPVRAGGVEHELVSVPAARQSYFDLECALQDAGDGAALCGYFAWCGSVVEDRVGEQLPSLFTALLAAALERPDAPVTQLALMHADVRQRVLRDVNATQAALPEWPTLHDGFLARASCEPMACALRSADQIEGGDWSYGILATHSARLAHELLARGAGSGSRVGVAIGRSPELVLAVLGVLRAGGVVVPLDPDFPAARLEFIARDADLALLIASEGRFSIEGIETFDMSDWLQRSTADETADLPEVQGDSAAFMLYTSGSTGEPKGAWTTHQAAVNRCHWMWHHFGFSTSDVFALRTTPNFIDAWWEIFGALVHGAPLQIVPDEVAADPLRLPAFVAGRGITQLVLVPSLLESLLDQIEVDGIQLPALRFCISSGEPLSPALASRCRQLLPSTTVINTYGTSEIWDATAFDVHDLEAGAERVPIGKPVANARVYVLDRFGEPLPPGIPGELCVAGLGVNGGYWRRPLLDAQRYIQAESPEIAGQRLYRTGDRGRYLADGNFECLGRLDAQFKLRGQRIEPAEIEQVLREHPAVAAAIVGVAGSRDDARLVAGIVRRIDAGPDASRSDAALQASLREHLQARLPGWMMPAEWRQLLEVPRTPTGKLDRGAWHVDYGNAPLITTTGGADKAARNAPSDSIERQLLSLWTAVMGRNDIGIHDNFFDIGGHSLLASRLLNRIRATFDVPLQLRDLFARPTVAGVAVLLRDKRTRVVENRAASKETAGYDGATELSFGQERLWFLDQLDPASPAWNVAWTIHVSGALDPKVLESALNDVRRRHPVLRTRIPTVAGRPVAVVDPPVTTELAIEEIHGGRLAERLCELARIPLDTERGPLFHARLLRVRPDDHHLLLVASHIVTDATSNHLLFEEIATALAGRPLAPLSPSVSYAEFARRQRDAAGQGVWQASLDWWVKCLAGAPPALELPTDYPRPAEQHYAGATVQRRLPAALVASMYRLAGERQCTPYMVLLAAFKALLHRYSGATDVLIGTPIEGRASTDVESVVGLFINTLVMRTDLSGDPSFDSLLARVRHTTLDAQAHQDLPFEKLVEALAPERSLSRSPVFQVLFNLIQVPDRLRHAGGLTLRMDRLIDQGVSGFDLSLTAAIESQGVTFSFEYATELFHESTIGYLADAYLELLQAALADPSLALSGFPLLGEAARNAVLALGQAAPLATATGAQPFKAVHEQVAEVARCRPDSVAVSLVMPDSGETRLLTYGELDARANQLARYLRTLFVGMPGANSEPVRIGICMPRTPDCLVAVLAVLKAGGAYVPLDPDWPGERLARLAADAMLSGAIVDGQSSLPLSSTGWCVDLVRDQHLISGHAATAPLQTTGPDSAAYLIHTSGSTGKPKAVIVTHANLAAAMAAWQGAWNLQAGEAHLQMAGIAFDVFSGDWIRALGSGGKLILCPREILLDPPALLAVLQHADIRIAEFVPAIMRALVAYCRATDARLPGLRLFIVGSDTWHASDLAALRAVAAPQTRLINSYGVAEATIDSCWFDATSGDIRGPVPVGRPFPGVALYVVDERGELLPPGVPGELCIGGSGVAAGYWNADPVDLARFTAGRRYRTGDIARWNPAGQLELIGRRDSQIKLRGFRIEPAEIEACLARCPGVHAAVVVLQPATPGQAGTEPRLIAWIATGDSADGGRGDAQHGPDVEELRLALSRQLPPQMVPAQFILRPTLPLTTSGKVDRHALAAYPVPALADSTAHGMAAAPEPANPVEAVIVEAVAGLLERSGIGVDDDFFRSGGHSLLAARLVARLRDTLQVELPLRAIFEAPTPRGLAAIIVKLRRGPQKAAQVFRPPVRHQRADADTAPLSAMQMRLWFLERLNPGSATYHLHWLLRLDGVLDRDALQGAIDVLIGRHEVLRSSFIDRAGVPVQSIAVEARVVVEVVAAKTAAERQAIIRDRVDQPFNLAIAPLLRVVLVPGAADEHRMLLVIHHLVADGWSFGILSRELAAAYNAARRKRSVPLPAVPLQYADYALWQQSAEYQARLREQLGWWQSVLAGAPAVLELASAAGRPVCPDPDTSSHGAWLERVIPAAETRKLRRLALAEGVTLFMVLLAVFKAVLGRLAHTDDVVVGTPVAGRSHRDLEDLIGFFVNTLVLRTSLTGDISFRELLVRVRHTTLEAFDHADVPFEKLVEVLQPARTLAHSPVVQVLFALHNQPGQPLVLDGLAVTAEAIPAGSVKFDLNLHVAEEGESLRLALAWRSSLYTEEAAATLLDACTGLISRAVTTPDHQLGELLEFVPLKKPAAAVPRPDDRCGPPVRVPTQGLANVSGDVPDAAVTAPLRDLWSALLSHPNPGLDDDFFLLGGHSLLAMRLVAAIAGHFGVELPLISVFEAPTICRMAGRIVDARRSMATVGAGVQVGSGAIRRLPRLADEGWSG